MLGSACIPRVRDWPGEWKGHNWFGQRIWRWHRSLDQQGFYLEMAELGSVRAEQALENRLSFEPSFHSPEIQPLLQICRVFWIYSYVHVDKHNTYVHIDLKILKYPVFCSVFGFLT